MLISARFDERPGVLGLVTGAVVGLVAITPAAGFVTPLAALIIGALAAPFSYAAIRLRQRWGLDESLDVWGCHGIAGTWGALATGLFATTAVNEAGANGLFYGNPRLLLVQGIAVVVSIVYAFGLTYIIAKALDAVMRLRVSEVEEEIGLDLSIHGERAYA